MAGKELSFEEVIEFHGHACPGLAFGYRVSQIVLKELAADRSEDEELVAIVENNSCAVDAIQAMTGCTFGKGNFVFRDYGKQVYTFIRRADGKALRISVEWHPGPESPETTAAWEKYSKGDRSSGVVTTVAERKRERMAAILAADDSDLFKVTRPEVDIPEKAQIFPTLRCVKCGEKVMAPRSTETGNGPVCIPCSDSVGILTN